MDSIAVIIIQKENVLIFSCRFDREAFHKIRVDQLGWPTNKTRTMFVLIRDAIESMLLADCWGVEASEYTFVLRIIFLGWSR